MTRTYQLMFDMINAGEFTPEEALEEARLLAKYGDIWQDAVELLIGWAWAKQDEFLRLLRAAKEAEVRTAENVYRTVKVVNEYNRLKDMRARWALSAALFGNGDEPF